MAVMAAARSQLVKACIADGNHDFCNVVTSLFSELLTPSAMETKSNLTRSSHQ